METRDKSLQRDPQRLDAVRRSLAVVADCLMCMDSEAAEMYLWTLKEELDRLRQSDPSTLAWGQVVSQFSDVDRARLARLRLVP